MRDRCGLHRYFPVPPGNATFVPNAIARCPLGSGSFPFWDVPEETAYPILIGVVRMREYPKGGIIGKTIHLLRWIRGLQIPLHAANACYFMVLAVFPALLLLLGLLRHTPLAVERLTEMLYGIFPEALAVWAEEVILLTYDNTGGMVMGISAITALWSAGRGIYGILTGLNAVYGVRTHRRWLHARLLSAAYTAVFLVLLLLTLGLHVFSDRVVYFLLPGQFLFLRSAVLLSAQTALFAAMFSVLPGGKNGFWESVPGALLAAFGWQIFSDLYSVYAERFAGLSNVYGSVYAVSLSMLWLYCCMSIVFYGGALNVLLKGKKTVSEQ